MASINVLEGQLYAIYDRDTDSGINLVEALLWTSEDFSQSYYIVGSKIYSGESEAYLDNDMFLVPVEARVEVTNLMMDFDGNRQDNIAEPLEFNDILQIVDKY